MRNSSSDRSNSLTARVTERLRRAVLDAEFDLGEALSEDRLATALGVSRTPVREALTSLQLQGLIDIEPQRGSFVFLPSELDIADLCEFRRAIEVEALSLCYARRKDATLAQMRRANEDIVVAQRAGDHLSAARADEKFHDALLENCKNRYLVEAYKLASGRVSALRAHMGTTDIQSRAVAEHRAIIAAMTKGDIQAAETILTDHIFKMRERYALAKGQGFLGGARGNRRSSSIITFRKTKVVGRDTDRIAG